MEKISVLVPTLGTREKELNRLFETLEQQTHKSFEVIIVSQDNHERVHEIIAKYNHLKTIHIRMNEKGLSKARNKGLEDASGEIIILSDDDCWYPPNAFQIIVEAFNNKSIKVLMSQILDPKKNVFYKKYNKKEGFIKRKIQLLKKSSIEIAFKKKMLTCKRFDERLGLGSEFVCGEEIDFLLNNFEKNSFYYIPTVTVYHKKKENSSDKKKIIAKGALYRKHFNKIICFMVLIKDLMVKRENNFQYFMEGYNEYFKRVH